MVRDIVDVFFGTLKELENRVVEFMTKQVGLYIHLKFTKFTFSFKLEKSK